MIIKHVIWWLLGCCKTRWLHPANVKYGLKHNAFAWYKMMIPPVGDDDPVYTLSVKRDPLFLVHTQFVRNFGHRLKSTGDRMILT